MWACLWQRRFQTATLRWRRGTRRKRIPENSRSVKHLSFLPARSLCLTRVKCVNFRPFFKLGSRDLLQQRQFFWLFWFPLQLFRQLDPPRSLSVFLSVVGGPWAVSGLCQDSVSQSAFAESCCSVIYPAFVSGYRSEPRPPKSCLSPRRCHGMA